VVDRKSIYIFLSIMKTVTVTMCSYKPMFHIVTTRNQSRFYVIFLQVSHLDTSAPTFARSAQERMLSFSERKVRLIENARQRYIEKHGLKSAGFSS
jgi:phage-related protein